MKVEKAGHRFVVECQHCAGTTLCRSATLMRANERESRGWGEKYKYKYRYWLFCQKCGDGISTERIVNSMSSEWPVKKSQKMAPLAHELAPPVCGVCEGRGFHIVE